MGSPFLASSRAESKMPGLLRGVSMGLGGYVVVHLDDFPLSFVEFAVRRLSDVGQVTEQKEQVVPDFEQLRGGGDEAGVGLSLSVRDLPVLMERNGDGDRRAFDL